MPFVQGFLSKRRFVIGGVAAACLLIFLVGLWLCSAPDVTSGSVKDRVAAVSQIVRQKPMGAERSLMTAAKDNSPIVRRAALVGFAQIGLIDADTRPVIEKAIQDKDPTVREAAAGDLGQFKDAKAAKELATLASAPKENKKVREAALRGLVPCKAPVAVVTMVQIAGDESIPDEVRLQAGKAMLAKEGGKLNPNRRPSNQLLWRDLVQWFKNDPRIRKAYRETGVKLVDHPGDVVSKQ